MSTPDHDDPDGVEDLDDAEADAARLRLVQAASGVGADPAEAFVPVHAGVEDWVREVFAPIYARRATPTFTWCPQWWRHPEAIARFEALWRAWEALRLDPFLGMGTWYRDHLDHHLPVLTGPAGPFAGCDPSRHFDPETPHLPLQAAPDGWWPPAPGAGKSL